MQDRASLAAGAADIPGDRAAVEHALNRLTFGPRPGQVDEVQRLGLARWIDRAAQSQRRSTTAPAVGLTPLPDRRPTIAARLATCRSRSAWRCSGAPGSSAGSRCRRWPRRRCTRAVYSERQLEEVLVDFWFNHFNVFAGKGRTADLHARLRARGDPAARLGQLPRSARRHGEEPGDALLSRQLAECRSEGGRTAHSSVEQPHARARLGRRGQRAGNSMPPPQQQAARRSGLNENYARELMELHTLGVDGGYTQQDIIEVARAFTGWTTRANPQRRRASASRRRCTTAARRRCSARRFSAGGGIDDGERVLDIVAAHPSTARHIATKLARRFVSDEPPAALVDRVGRDVHARPKATCARSCARSSRRRSSSPPRTATRR